MSRVRRRAQRQCRLDAHCPSDSVCCADGCGHHGKICKKKARNSNALAYRPSKVNMTVIMTSASAESQQFLTSYLAPLELSLRNYVRVEVVPFGRVENGGCQHGPGDCLGNRLISCSERHLAAADRGVAFAVCLTKYQHQLRSADHSAILSAALSCAEGSRRNTKAFYRCAVGPEGYQLFAAAGRRQYQLVPFLSYVPTVLIDGEVVVRSYGDMAKFPSALCSKLDHLPQVRSYCQSLGHQQVKK
ncbi:putative gamma-interferon-inducible lysosomal thiol reductase-like isoform X1 [Penaeus vannamei]|uniref:Putative gamma-interferon-inducible lysosomal thiol reductase-like isoform X1 n=1 Tax=Penaeus vannamei TaxID=6689 RepID=A0A423SN79_PENVA|nr:GILT-like protein 1 [Penaeus vannamei]ROT65609.1 putative gamma-interferon-inducible lysosomal thiol reductase-like isoform X1 [Penaeus vannamei]